MANDVALNNFSSPTVGIGGVVTAVTNTDGTTANAITISTVPQNWTPSGVWLWCEHVVAEGKTAQAYYVSYDTLALTTTGTTEITTTVTFNLYVKATTTNPNPKIHFFVF